jgi:uncharacterized protein YjlB
MSRHVQSTHVPGARELPEITLHTLTDDGVFPNNARLPLTVYRQAVAVPKRDPAAGFEVLFAANHWPPAWRSSIFGYHHYHSTAHEALGVFRGRATLQCGGEHGIVVEVQAGDVVVIPAGVAHKSLRASQDFCAVGAYPRRQQWDTCTGAPGERPRTDRNIASVPLPAADPLYGPHGPLMTHWSAGEYRHD